MQEAALGDAMKCSIVVGIGDAKNKRFGAWYGGIVVPKPRIAWPEKIWIPPYVPKVSAESGAQR
jgi:hypothetical protein